MKRTGLHLLRAAFTAAALAAVLTVASFASQIAIGIGIVNTDGGLWLREGPGSGYDVIDAASEGDDVVVYAQEGDWYLVNYNLKVGYMSTDYIDFLYKENVRLGDGVVLDDLINLRGTPETSGTLLTQLEYGDTARIIGLNNGWYKVEYDCYTGYIRSDLLELTDIPLDNSLGYYDTISGASSAGQAVVDYAKQFLGTPYVWGGTTPSGFDCSGFCQYVYKQMGYTINRVAADQMNNGVAVSMSELQAGDLVFFANSYGVGHVGIYISDGNFIHAPQSGDVVKISNLYTTNYGNRFAGARRIV